MKGNPRVTAKWQEYRHASPTFLYYAKAVGLVWLVILIVFCMSYLFRTSTKYDANEPGNFLNVVITPSQTGHDKAIISSFWGHKSADWITKLLPEWKTHIYNTQDVHKNFNTSLESDIGHEAAFYLTYIIDNYHNLPNYMVFYHGPRYQWHNDDRMFDGYPTIANLSLQYVAEQGYVPLRCDKRPGCAEAFVRPDINHNDGFFGWDALVAEIFHNFWPHRRIPKLLAAPCCAQFAVSREAVQRNSLARYKRWRAFIWHKTGLGLAVKVGLAMEYSWHVIFGKPPRFCAQPPEECYCKTWGACDLECNNVRCLGQYWRNPLHKLQKEWPDKAVQGKDGWPRYGWWLHDKFPG